MRFFASKFQNPNSLVLVIVAGTASYLDAALLVSAGVVLPLWTNHFELNPWMVGMISTLLTVAVAIGSFTGGWLSDKFGRVHVFNVDIFFVAVGAATIGFANNIPMLLTGVFIAGVASGADLPTSLSVISERMSKNDYGKAISGTQLFWTVGILLSQFIGFATASMNESAPKIIFGWIALVAFGNWLVRVFSKKFKDIEKGLVEQNQNNEENSVEYEHVSIGSLLKSKRYLMSILLLTGFYLFWNLPANTWGSFINYFLVIVSERTQSYATLIVLIANIFCLLVNVWYLKVSDTKRRYPVMYVGIIIAFFSFIVAGIFSDQWLLFTIAYIFYSGSTVLCGEPLYKIWSQLIYPQNARASLTGFSYGIVRALTAVFSLVTPAIMGYSPKLLMWILVGCVAVFGCCATLVTKLIKHYGIEGKHQIAHTV